MLSRFHAKAAFRWLAVVFLATFLFACESAQLGVFNREIAAALVLALAALAGVSLLDFSWSAIQAIRPGSRFRGWIFSAVFGGILACVAVYLNYYHTPSDRIFGACDEGLYASTAINLCRTGGYVLRAPILDEMSAAEKTSFLRSEPAAAQRGAAQQQGHPRYHVGLFLRGTDSPELTPQFPLGWPTILASFFALGGWAGFHTANTVLMIVGAALTGLLALWWFGPITALCSFALFLFFPLNAWAARSIFSEPALEAAWLLAIVGWREGRRAPILGGVITGLAAGALLFLKIEATFVVAALFALCAWRIADRGKYAFAFCVSALFSLGLAASAWMQFNQFYLADTFSTIPRKALWVAAAGAIAFAWALSRPELHFFLTRNSRKMHWLRRTAFWLLVALAFYGAVLRPEPATPDTYYYWPAQGMIRSFREESFLRLSWYWQPWGLAAATLGAAAMACTVRKPWQFGFWGVGLLFLIGLSYDIRNNPTQPYAMRRYLPFAMPMLLIGAGSFGRRAVNCIVRRNFRKPWMQPVGQFAVTTILLGGFIPINQTLNRHVEYERLPANIGAIANKLPPRSLVLVSEATPLALLATPLQFVFGRECLILPQAAFTAPDFPSLVESWEASGRKVYLLSEKSGVQWISHGRGQVLNATEYGVLSTSYLFQSPDARPSKIATLRVPYHLIPLEGW